MRSLRANISRKVRKEKSAKSAEKKRNLMWQIIKTEYYYSLLTNKWKTIGIVVLMALFSIAFQDLSIIVIYSFIGGLILSFQDEKRFYIFQTLPVKPRQIAYARLIMLGINYSILLVFTLPLLLLKEIKTMELDNFFFIISLFLLVRLLTFSLADVINGMLGKRQRTYFYMIIFSIVIIATLLLYNAFVYLRQPELKTILATIAVTFVPIYALLSIKTLSAKEIITVREE